ncbi:MAG: hypothetical protein RR557_07790 [Bacilli bacterium]
MNELEKKVALIAIDGLRKEEYKESLEKILILVTSSTKQLAYEKALDLRAEEDGAVTVNDINLKECKVKYGYFKGYPVIQLALDYFQMSNDMFWEKYHFNYVPEGKVFTEIKKIIQDVQLQKSFMKSYMGVDISSVMNIERNFFQNGAR